MSPQASLLGLWECSAALEGWVSEVHLLRKHNGLVNQSRCQAYILSIKGAVGD